MKARVEQLVARRAHNAEVAGSTPAPATIDATMPSPPAIIGVSMGFPRRRDGGKAPFSRACSGFDVRPKDCDCEQRLVEGPLTKSTSHQTAPLPSPTTLPALRKPTRSSLTPPHWPRPDRKHAPRLADPADGGKQCRIDLDPRRHPWTLGATSPHRPAPATNQGYARRGCRPDPRGQGFDSPHVHHSTRTCRAATPCPMDATAGCHHRYLLPSPSEGQSSHEGPSVEGSFLRRPGGVRRTGSFRP